MGIFGRMKTLLKANVNDLASKAENPERILNQLIIDMQEQLKQAKLQVRDTITDQKRLEKQYAEASKKAQEWEKKAMVAVKAGRDELAREALSRKSEEDENAAQYKANLESQTAMAEDLKNSLRRLSEKIEEAKRKKNSLIARQQRVEAQNSMSTTVAATKNSSAFDAFEANAQKIEEFEFEVAAEGELSNDFQDQNLAAKFSDLEKGHGADDELARLKAKMGMNDD